MPMIQDHVTGGPAQPQRQTQKPESPPSCLSLAAEQQATSLQGINSRQVSLLSSLLRSQTSLSRKTSDESIRTDLCDGPIPETSKLSAELQPAFAVDLQSGHLPPTAPQPPPSPVTNRAELIERIKKGERPLYAHSHPSTLLEQYHAIPNLLLPPPAFVREESRHVGEEEGDLLWQGDKFTHLSQSPLPPRHSLAISIPCTPLTRSSSIHWAGLNGGDEHHLSSALSSSMSSFLSRSHFYQAPTSPLVHSVTYHYDLDSDVPIDDNPLELSLDTSHVHAIPPNSGYHPLPRRRSHRHFYQAHQPCRSITFSKALNFDLPVDTNPSAIHSILETHRSRSKSPIKTSVPLTHASLLGSYEESILHGRMSTQPSKPIEFTAKIGALGLGKCKPELRFPPHVTLPFSAVFYSFSTAQGDPHSTDPLRKGLDLTDARASPYVGQIDLEAGLALNRESNSGRRNGAEACDQRARRKTRHRYPIHPPNGKEELGVGDDGQRSTTATTQYLGIDYKSATIGNSNVNQQHDSENSEPHTPPRDTTTPDTDPHDEPTPPLPTPMVGAIRKRRRARSPKDPIGGRYRIPERGQLQIVIQNQLQTAVRLFIMPYDLAGMEPGTKTFIRQRGLTTTSWSATTTAEPLAGRCGSSPSHPQPPCARTSATTPTNANCRPLLRSLVHLQVCCPARDRFYLYKTIRIVFTNGDPDCLDESRVDVTYPDPKYSPYRPAGGSKYDS